MSNQEFREHAAGAWGHVAAAHNSPAWVQRPPLTISDYLATADPADRSTTTYSSTSTPKDVSSVAMDLEAETAAYEAEVQLGARQHLARFS